MKTANELNIIAIESNIFRDLNILTRLIVKHIDSVLLYNANTYGTTTYSFELLPINLKYLIESSTYNEAYVDNIVEFSKIRKYYTDLKYNTRIENNTIRVFVSKHIL